MSEGFFAGAFGGDVNTLADDARLECRICWHVYDPAEGDAYWQIPPGTPFSKLPDHWSCPVCDSPRDGFILIEEGR